MKLVAAAFCLSLLAAILWVGLSLTSKFPEGEEKPGEGGGGVRGCFLPPLPKEDTSLCRNLEVFFMEMGDISCKIVPKCNLYRQKITTWPSPIVKFHAALDGADMKSGNIRGNVITAYKPPNPPPTTGLHRYQFFVYFQGDRDISIPEEENENRGAWKLDRFLQQYGLTEPDTSTQFMTQFDGEVPPGFSRINED